MPVACRDTDSVAWRVAQGPLAARRAAAHVQLFLLELRVLHVLELALHISESRGLSLLESGWLHVLPFATGAIMCAVGGLACDALCRRIGAGWGCRLPAMTGLILVGVFLYAGAYATNPYVAVCMLSLCFGFILFIEGPFWAASTYAAGPHASAATGVMNTGGNIPGLLAPAVGMMIDHPGWLPTLASGSLFAFIGAILWLFVGRQGDAALRLRARQKAPCRTPATRRQTSLPAPTLPRLGLILSLVGHIGLEPITNGLRVAVPAHSRS